MRHDNGCPSEAQKKGKTECFTSSKLNINNHNNKVSRTKIIFKCGRPHLPHPCYYETGACFNYKKKWGRGLKSVKSQIVVNYKVKVLIVKRAHLMSLLCHGRILMGTLPSSLEDVLPISK